MNPDVDRDELFERLHAAKTVIPAIAGFDIAHEEALGIAAFMELVEGKPLTARQFQELLAEKRREHGR